MTFSELRAALQSGDVSAVEALHSYQAKALDVHSRTNCLVEPIWEAEVRAQSAISIRMSKLLICIYFQNKVN